jgi:hypothetical protein
MADEPKQFLSKKDIEWLGKVFEAEINGRLPFQSKSKELPALCDKGYLAPMKRQFGRGPFAAIAEGYELTHAGRFVYCVSTAGARP